MPAARGSNGINASGDLAAATSAASSGSLPPPHLTPPHPSPHLTPLTPPHPSHPAAREGNGRGGGKRREAPLEGKAGVCSEESHYFQDPYKRGLSAQFMEEVIAECQARCANPFGTCPLRPSCKLQMSSQPGGNLLVDFDHDKPVYKGGLSTLENVRALCPSCHADKTRNVDRAKEIRPARKWRRCPLTGEWTYRNRPK